MKIKWMQTGLKNRFVIAALLTLLCVTIGIVSFSIYEMRTQMRTYLEQKAEVVARIAAQSAAVGLVFDDVESVTSELKVVEVSPDVSFALVFRKDGSRFASYGQKVTDEIVAQAKTAFQSPTVSQIETPERLLVVTPIMQEKQRLGTLVLGVSLERLQKDTWRVTGWAILLGLLISALGSVIFYFLASRIAGSLERRGRGRQPPGARRPDGADRRARHRRDRTAARGDADDGHQLPAHPVEDPRDDPERRRRGRADLGRRRAHGQGRREPVERHRGDLLDDGRDGGADRQPGA